MKITEINTSPTKYLLGMYFTTNREYAKCYGKNILEVNLKMNNPFDLRTGDLSGYVDAKKFAKELPLSKKEQEIITAGVTGNALAWGILELGIRYGLINNLKSMNYDGLIYNEGYGETWIPFYKEQILPVGNKTEKIFYHGSKDIFKIEK